MRKLVWHLLALAAGAVAFVLLGAAPAAAQVNLVIQDSEITNSGTAVANSGGNAAIGNTTVGAEVATSPQVAVGSTVGLPNVGFDRNESDGSSSISTGNATATGNQSTTAVTQSAVIPPAPNVNDDSVPGPVAAASAPASTDTSAPPIQTSEAPGSTVPAGTATAVGGLASTAGSSSGLSPVPAIVPVGSAGTNAGASVAPAASSQPLDNSVQGAVSGAGPPAFNLVRQSSTVDNNGEATANTGLNGGVFVVTGNATATGNQADTAAAQSAVVAGGGLVFIGQTTDVTNEGNATANTGLNLGGGVFTGNATATGNQSGNATAQGAAVTGSSSRVVIGQDTGITNQGDGNANTGRNLGLLLLTGNATAAGNIADTTTTQQADVAQADPTAIDQATDTDNLGSANANTGLNTNI